MILLILIKLLQAESYTFSGGKNNGAQEIGKIILEKAYLLNLTHGKK
ncbi:MAG: hypothetical protein SPLUMA2_SPLUMAMAG2_01299 [uncultured Sulfurimonas sp.]|nr:MAG: hypothetical protein SPLUMA1_SPLUMAMAG1_00109 [uncultured Sulfurimonas sp.]CAI6166047.1 MAG: hypothetical protein SPLUMA2_SPLUMAMAG2_01299 [uncultured Sulfurimonas sp.]